MTVTSTQSQIPNKLPIRKQDSHEYLLAAIRATRSWWVWQEALLSLGKTTWIIRSDWRLLRFTWITNFTIMVNFKQGRPFNSILSVHTSYRKYLLKSLWSRVPTGENCSLWFDTILWFQSTLYLIDLIPITIFVSFSMLSEDGSRWIVTLGIFLYKYFFFSRLMTPIKKLNLSKLCK